MVDNKTLANLGFFTILDMVRSHSLYLASEYVTEDSLLFDEERILKRRGKVESMLSLLEAAETMPESFQSLSELFSEEEAHESCYSGQAMRSAAFFISSMKALSAFLGDESIINPGVISLMEEIFRSLDEDGSVSKDCPTLLPLYEKAEEIRGRRAEFSKAFISSNKSSVQAENPVYRNGRVVIPIKREGRGAVQGYVGGVSSSGQTLFMEPFDLVELNNQAMLSDEEILREKHRILVSLSGKIREAMRYLRKAESFVRDFDFHYCIALFVQDYAMKEVKYSDSLNLMNARHPLLGDKAVPINFSADPSCHAIVISGANAGGKSVTMKTVGLFSLISSLTGFCPFDEGSEMPLYADVFSDIGDGQSIEDSLSTFSSHMQNVSRIASSCAKGSLVLLDELCSGTDPDEGSALSIALLEHFSKKASLVIITSHYGKVKLFAYERSDMLNVGMEFDENRMEPTYRVTEGLPGDSHAMAIAAKMRLPEDVLRRAGELMGSNVSVSRLVSELNGRKRDYERKITELEAERKECQRAERKAEEERRELERKRHELEKSGITELSKFIKKTRSDLELLVKDLSIGELTKEKKQRMKAYISSLGENEKAFKEKVDKDEESLRPRAHIEFNKGDEVLCGKAKSRGVLLDKRGKGKWNVAIGSMRMTLSEDMLYPAPKEAKATVSPFGSSAPRPKSEIDVRGKTLAETLEILDREIEGCLVHGIGSFSVIHGFGGGILSEGIHAYLKKRREVKDYYFASPEDGGMGKTYVLF